MGKMSADMLMQVGRVVYVNYGPAKGSLAVVVDMVDENRILVEGPTTNEPRQLIPIKRLTLTKFRINKVLRNQKQSVLKKNIQDFKLEKRFSETGMAKKMNQQNTRANLSDFDRFRALVLRRKLAKEVRGWVNKNRSKIN